MIRGVPDGAPWSGQRILSPADDVIRFEGQRYDIRMDADGTRLVWSVPPAVAERRGIPSSYPSPLERIEIASSVEAWRFPKTGWAPTHEVVVLLDRTAGTVVSLELMLHAGVAGPKPAVKLQRGTLLDHPSAYAGAAFPRHRTGARAVAFGSPRGSRAIEFDRTSQPVRTVVDSDPDSRSTVTLRTSGHAVVVAEGLWVALTRTRESADLTLLDERVGTAEGQRLLAATEELVLFSDRIRPDQVR